MASAVPNHFALFGIVPRFALDLGNLEAAYKRVQSQVHPDRFAAGTAAERRIAMQWASQANEAYRTLRSPARRAAYLCELNGVLLNAESNTAMPADFLMQHLEWREALDAAAGSADAGRIEAVARESEAARDATLDALREALDSAHDFARASALARQLMFIDKLRDEIGVARFDQEEAA
jgi:molecular chaperone HscB